MGIEVKLIAEYYRIVVVIGVLRLRSTSFEERPGGLEGYR